MCEKARILVIDDEWVIADSIQYTIENLGYQVVGVLCAKEAHQQLVENPSAYVAIITDIDLGEGMDGWCLARIAREVLPSIGIIYCTGRSVEQWRSHGLVGSCLVQKPFRERDLADALQYLVEHPMGNPSEKSLLLMWPKR